MLRRCRPRATQASLRPRQLAGSRFRQPGKAARADRYLRENVKYALGEREKAGLRRFYELAAEVGVLAAAENRDFIRAAGYRCTGFSWSHDDDEYQDISGKVS